MEAAGANIRKRIQRSGRGSLFTATDFLDLGTRDAVDQALSRLTIDGTLERLARGVYTYPAKHPVLGALEAKPETVANALAKRDAVKIQPAGAYAANLLGLSEQVPAKIVFLTDGPARVVKVRNTEIVLRRTTPRNMATAGRLSGLLIQALRYIGRDKVTPQMVTHLRHTVPTSERAALLRDLRYAPVWMHTIFRELAREDD